jgi:hypothetical protein
VFIVWGRKIKRRTAGYVADYCPVCRAKRVFALQEVRSAGHVYYISLGTGKVVGHEKKCDECGTPFKANPAAYVSVAKARMPLEELRSLTFPGLEAAIKPQLELDERIRRQRITTAERQSLLKAPFIYLSPLVERRFAQTHLDAGSAVALAGTAVLVILAGLAGERLMPDSRELFIFAALGIGIAAVVWQMFASGSRFMKREIVPVLAKSLKPLQPTREEIEVVLGELSKLKQKIGRKLRVSELIESMQAPPVGLGG